MNQVMNTLVEILTSSTSRQAFQALFVAVPTALTVFLGLRVAKSLGTTVKDGVSVVSTGLANWSKGRQDKRLTQAAEVLSRMGVGVATKKIEVGKPVRIVRNSTAAFSPVNENVVAKPGEYFVPIKVEGNDVYYRSAGNSLCRLPMNDVEVV